MKKSLAIVLALVFVLSIAATAFAAAPANPFVDVPAKHWAYGAVSKLAKAGIVDGYGDGTFRGDKTMTRYEMAQITAKAMAKSDKADAELKALIDKLAVEFAAELNNLGVRVAKLEKNASTIKFTGDSRIRYQQNQSGNDFDNKADSRFNFRVRLNMAATVADNVAFNGRMAIQNQVTATGAADVGKNDEFDLDLGYFTFKNVMPLADFQIGRMNNKVGTGLLFSADYYDGVKLSFGNKLKGWAGYGDWRYAPGPNANSGAVSSGAATSGSKDNVAKVLGIFALQYNTSKVTSLSATATQSGSNNYYFEQFQFGFKTKLSPDFALNADAVVNEHDKATGERTAWYGELVYKGADFNKVGTWGLFVNYRKVGAMAIDPKLANGLDFFVTRNTSGSGSAMGNFQGMGYGFNYTIAKNAVFQLSLEELEQWGYTTNKDAKTCVYAQTNFKF